MNYIVTGIIICIFFAIFGLRTEKRALNPVTVFVATWGIIICFSVLRLYTLYSASMRTYGWILLGIAFFILGYYFIRIFSGKKKPDSASGNDSDAFCTEYTPRYRVLYLLSAISILFLYKDIAALGSRLFANGFDLRTIQTVIRQGTAHTGIENAIRFLFIEPYITAVSAITAIDLWLGKRDKKLLALTIAIMIGKVLSTGGRESFIKFFIFVFVGYIFAAGSKSALNEAEREKNRIRNKRRIIFIFVIAVFSLLTLSLSRAGTALIKTFYLDFAMQPYMLEYWGKAVEAHHLFGNGFASLNGFFYPLLYIAKNLLKIFSDIPNYYASIYNMTMLPDSQWIYIGKTATANAYVSAFWYLYYDAREFGIAFGMFLYGMISSSSYRAAVNKTNARNVALYALILAGVFYTFGRMEFTTNSYALAILFVVFAAYKKEKVTVKAEAE